jgi:osmotically-inducible protein OsmY
MRRIAITASLAFLMLGAAGVNAQEKKPAPDNTKVNKTASPTADNASNSATDRELMQKIRKAVMDDKSLSTYAHNTKIIAKAGKVTLKGPVNSPEEKAAIERIATDVAGAGNVTNQITVKPAKKT